MSFCRSDCLTDWRTNRPTTVCRCDWLCDWFAYWLSVFLMVSLTSWPTDWPTNWLTTSLSVWLSVWLIVCLAGWLTDRWPWMSVFQTGWLRFKGWSWSIHLPAKWFKKGTSGWIFVSSQVARSFRFWQQLLSHSEVSRAHSQQRDHNVLRDCFEEWRDFTLEVRADKYYDTVVQKKVHQE